MWEWESAKNESENAWSRNAASLDGLMIWNNDEEGHHLLDISINVANMFARLTVVNSSGTTCIV